MICPYCQFDESTVLESREAQDGKATRRRRECLRCGKRFTTYEKVGNIELKVVKKDGRVEDYSREKLEKCFEKACYRVPREARIEAVEEIEMKLLNWEKVEIPSKEIGRMVMEKLKEIDEVGYVRFATVYLDINSIDELQKFIADFKRSASIKN
ncbi:MAG: transcriptional regulator NrdR [Candidatus Shapirobacteria bacterium]